MDRDLSLTTLLVATTVAVACLGAATRVSATSPDWSRLDDPRLEQIFWDCDARAALEAMSLSDGALCASLSDELKRRRFGGDFERLLAWWHERKAVEHGRRGAPAPVDTDVQVDDLTLQTP